MLARYPFVMNVHAALAIVMLAALAWSPHAHAQAVRLRFAPRPHDEAAGSGADFSALHHMAADKPGVLMLMAHAGVGDSFPVAEEGKPKIFDIFMVAGDDDLLRLEIRTAGATQQIDLKRDGNVSFLFAGQKYVVAYPSVHVNPDGEVTTDRAMIIVNRVP